MRNPTRSSEKAGWIVQFACLFVGYSIFLTTFAMIKTIGVFFIQLQIEFGATAAQASFTVSVPSTIVFLGGPIYGAIFNVIGIKQTYGLSSVLMFLGFGACFFAPSLAYVQIFFGIAGFGAGLANVATLALMGRAFYTSRPMAMAALAMGGSTAAAVITPVMQWCIYEYTWRGALLILGAYCLHGMACGFAIEPLYNTIVRKRKNALVARVLSDDSTKEPVPEPKTLEAQDTKAANKLYANPTDECSEDSRNPNVDTFTRTRRKSSIYDRFYALSSNVATAFDLSMLKDRWFIAYCSSCGLSICSRLLSGLYLVRYAQYVGLTDQEAAMKLTICELVAFCVMPIVAIITSVKEKTSRKAEPLCLPSLRRALSSIRSSFILGTFQLLMSLVIAISTTCETNEQMATYAALLGVCYGGITFLTNAVLADLFGTKRLPGAFGYRSLSSGILFLITPPIIGHLIDLTGTYDVAQYFTSAMTLVAGILTIVTQFALLRKHKSETSNQS